LQPVRASPSCSTGYRRHRRSAPAALTARRVADLHGHTCDLGDQGTPASSVTIVREGDQGLGYLVLFDLVIVLDGPSELKVVTDRRVDELVAAQRRHRNQPGGYWVAGAKPAAACEAVAGSLPRSLITRTALLSDGVSCLVERYGAGDWSWLLTVLPAQPDDCFRIRVRVARSDN
jgi:hypothetical protein